MYKEIPFSPNANYAEPASKALNHTIAKIKSLCLIHSQSDIEAQ